VIADNLISGTKMAPSSAWTSAAHDWRSLRARAPARYAQLAINGNRVR
jgi:hypothetical protein